MGLGFAWGNLGEADSALAAFRQAHARSDRLPERARLFVETSISYATEDIASTLALNSRQVEQDPQNPSVYINRSAYLNAAGRFGEALECAKTAEKISPFGASQMVLVNQFWSLLWGLDRVEEARALVARLRGRNALEAPMDVAAAAGLWTTAESLATALRSNPLADDDLRLAAATFQAAAQASRGEVTAADQTLRQAQSNEEATRELIRVNWTRWDRLGLALFSHGVATGPESPGSWDSTTAGLVVRGAWAAAAGDSLLARRLLVTIRKRSGRELARQGFLAQPEIVEGWLAARAGRWEEVLGHLGPAALQGEAPGYLVLGGVGGSGAPQAAPVVRWLVAEAYEQLGRPDSAAAYFERAIAPPPAGGTNITQTRTAFSFGQCRLALLYARMGRPKEARRHWEIFSATFTKPDPDMKPLVDEARAAVVSAGAWASSAKR
jgi:tetratricopeptide (TPR) repeat protein